MNEKRIKVEEFDDDEEFEQCHKSEDNIEFLTRIMTFPKSGPMMHMVVMEALGRYSKHVVDTGLDGTRAAFGNNPMINPDAWYDTCKELHDEIEKRLGPRSK